MKKIFTLAAAAMLVAGVNAQEVITLDLTNPANPETIEYNEDGSWTETYNDEIPYIEFTPFAFSHVLGGSWGGYYWDGFTVTKSGDNTDWYSVDGNWTAHQWYSITGGGVKTENGEIVADNGVAEADANAPFLVGYYGSDYAGATYEACNLMFNDGEQYEALGVYVTNHTWPYYSYTNGDGFARAFDQEGDYFKLIAHGIDASGDEIGTAEFMLASFNNGQLQAVNQWTWWDLSSLGMVDQINFTMDSSDKGDWGINTAKYFCMDKLQVRVASPTAVEDVDAARTVAGVHYVNMAGQQSEQPFEGVNVVVTRYTDGTTSTTKVVR
ncbi:MAG: DUF4465 domain-containing protein [Muribaculaceae bacterium]|nr:DUF4465 domain-containing protein [Muribaculaceae bacterium]